MNVESPMQSIKTPMMAALMAPVSLVRFTVECGLAILEMHSKTTKPTSNKNRITAMTAVPNDASFFPISVKNELAPAAIAAGVCVATSAFMVVNEASVVVNVVLVVDGAVVKAGRTSGVV